MLKEATFTEEELKWAKTLIKPDLPDYDEKDHEIAKLRYVMNCMVEEMFEIQFNVSEWGQDHLGASWFDRMYRRLYNWWWKFTGKRQWKFMPREPHRTMEDVHKAISNILFTEEGNSRMPDGESQKVIDEYAELHNWDYYRDDHVNGYHCGDCTAVPASCGKCHAEQFYGFKSPWEGKAKGWKALNIYTTWLKQQKTEKGEN